MKICFICPEYPPGPHGGMGTFVQEMGRALVRAGHQVRVIGIYSPDYPSPDYERDQGVEVWRLRSSGMPYAWILARFRMYRMVRKWIRAGQVEVVDAHDPEGWFAGWPKLPIPLMIRAGGSFSYFAHELGKPLPRNIYRFESRAYRRADAWIAKSRYIGDVTQSVFKLPSGPNAILYNPINAPAQVAPFSSRRPCEVVFTGTLTPKKGIISLIDAWPMVKKEWPAAELHIYGKDGQAPSGEPMQAFLKQRLAPPLHSSVRFYGHVNRDKLFAALNGARVAVFPSFAEGFAWAPLEAMALSCPTIYTILGSGGELIQDGRDGLLIHPNHPAQLAGAIVKVLKNHELASRLSSAGRERVLEAFSMSKLLPLNESFYANLIEQFQHRTVAAKNGQVASASRTAPQTGLLKVR